MNVQELMNRLAIFPADMQVVMSKDGEGNDHSPLSSVTAGMYTPESTWSGQYNETETLGDEDYEQPGENAVPAVCLWPVN